MKKIFTLLACTLGLVIMANSASFAQSTATANSTATIITPIAIAAGTQLSFGSFATNASGGTVTIAAAATPNRQVSGGVTISSVTPGTPAASSFAVTGQANQTFTATLNAASVTLTGVVNTGKTMTFVPALSATNNTLSGAGALTIYVGGVLTVGASMPADTYNNTGGISVTVNYN